MTLLPIVGVTRTYQASCRSLVSIQSQNTVALPTNHTNRTANGALVSAAEIARMKGNYPKPTPHEPQPFTPCIEAQSWAEVAALVAQYHTNPEDQRMQEYPNEVEAGALDYAGKQAAQFIESIAKTDLATFSAQDWQTMVSCACNGYVDYIVRTRAMAIDAASKIITEKDIPY